MKNIQRPVPPKNLNDDDEPPQLIALVNENQVLKPISQNYSIEQQHHNNNSDDKEKVQILEAHLKYFTQKKKQFISKETPQSLQQTQSPLKSSKRDKQGLTSIQLPDGNFEKIKNLAQKFIEEAQQNMETDLTDNQNILSLIDNLEEEKQVLKVKQKQLQIKLGNQNKGKTSELKLGNLNTQLDLIGQNILLIDRLQVLYKDKISLRKKNDLSTNLISSLLTSLYDMSCNLTNQMHELTKYYGSLPNDREIKLKQEIERKDLELEKFNWIESQIQSHYEYLENLSKEADEAKFHIIQQLKEIRMIKQNDYSKEVVKVDIVQSNMQQEIFKKVVKKVQIVESLQTSQKKLKQNELIQQIPESTKFNKQFIQIRIKL